MNVNTKGGILLAFRFTANFERSVQWCELIVSPQDSLTVRFVSRADVVKVLNWNIKNRLEDTLEGWIQIEFSLQIGWVSHSWLFGLFQVYHVRLIDGQNFVYNVDLKKYPNFIKGKQLDILEYQKRKTGFNGNNINENNNVN